ncbi:MAG: tRNA (N6-threonylcarbamoyladenosine(37)-N6)-methyltransferase TrmO [Melioribacteraceae bacterium]|nr:tRNA (N6-threonylcarbamoyladenosine(37)-N6)-methyltransferase TrmO [Melioribacteraceae bacterium]
MEEEKIEFRKIGVIRSPHKTPEGIPIQPVGAEGVKAEIELLEEYQEGLKDLENFSHLIVIYHFHKSQGFDLIVKPYLQEESHGVFATRAPKRPNPIGLSVLKLNKIVNNVLYVENVDILDGTPVLDIKPYVSRFDFVQKEKIGWLENEIHESREKKSDGRFR